MSRIVIAILAVLMLTSTGCIAIGDFVHNTITFPQQLEQSDDKNVRIAGTIAQRSILKSLRRSAQKREREWFRQDPSYRFEDLLGNIEEIRQLGTRHKPDTYLSDINRNDALRDEEREGEDPIDIIGNDNLRIDDEGGVRASILGLLRERLGIEIPWVKYHNHSPTELEEEQKEEDEVPIHDPVYEFDSSTRFKFSPEQIIEDVRAELGLTRYSPFFREEQWRLSLDSKYELDTGDWAAFLQWEFIF